MDDQQINSVESSLAYAPSSSKTQKTPARPSIGKPEGKLKRNRRCLECESCLRKPCDKCKNCLSKKNKQACIYKQCSNKTNVPSPRKKFPKKEYTTKSTVQLGVPAINAVTVQVKPPLSVKKEVHGGDLPDLESVSADIQDPVYEPVKSGEHQDMEQDNEQPSCSTDKGKMTYMKIEATEGQQDTYSDLIGYSGDVFPDMDSETLQHYKPPVDDIPKPFYFPSQIFRADIVVEHIEFILKHYHGKTLKEYNDFEFQIYTAKSKSLEEQTLMRLMERNAQCFRRIFYEKKRSEQYGQAREHVNQYVKSKRSVDRNKKLLEQAKDNRQTLYLIVADEAHWGISSGVKTADKTQEVDQESTEVQGAHNTFINKWNHDEYPNVIVLQISATPYNLMTSSSRLPNDVQVAKLQGQDNLVHVKKERHKVYDCTKGNDNADVTGKIGPMRNLHCIEWSDGLVKDFQGGVVARIQIPKESGILWLKSEDCQRGKSEQAKKLVGTDDIEDSDEFILETSNGSDLMIYTVDRQYKMVVTKDTAHKKVVRMVPSKISNSKKISIVDIFQLKLNFGEDIMEFYCPGSEEMLFYHHDNNEMFLGRLPTDNNPDDMVVKLFPRHDLKYQFIIYSWRREGVDVQDKQYLSLNHYYNSMRDYEQEPLLKYDPMFENYKSKSTELDALLIAEYAMFILMYGCLNELDIDKEFESFREILLCQAFDSYFTMKEVKFKEFKKTLHKPAIETISDSDFDLIVKFYEDETSEILRKSLKHSRSEDRLDAFMWHILFGNDKDSIKQSFIKDEPFEEPVDFNYLKHKILDKIETYNIVKDLIWEIDDSKQGKEIKGHMKIVRVSKMEWGDKFYKTVCNARTIKLPNEKRPYFEVIRDYGNFRLSEFDKEDRDQYINGVLHRIRSLMQTPSCHHLSSRFENCLCRSYVARNTRSDLTCKHCGHLHKDVNQYVDLNGLPCLLILIDKGRLGDTFPDSMNTMDLRLNNKGKSQPYLTSVIQELGRMSRYTSKAKADRSNYPYALLGSTLHAIFEAGLRQYVPMYGQFVLANHIDSRIKVDKNGLCTKEDHYDRKNTDKHLNRILLKAEPQIGKTGVFLNVIKQLREKIDRNNAVEIEDDYDDLDIDEETDDDPALPTSKEQHHVRKAVDMEEWRKVPYWKDMKYGQNLPQYKPNTKYSEMYGPYKWGKEPKLLHNKESASLSNKRKQKTGSNPKEEFTFLNQQYKAHTLQHRDKCVMCQKPADVFTSFYKFKSNGVSFQLSIPKSCQYFPVMDRMGFMNANHGNCSGSEVSVLQEDLKSWIFTPTYERHSVGNLNLRHTMVDNDGDKDIPRKYVHILIVRENQFDIYSQNFSQSHCIIKLPDTLPNTEMNSIQGGVGFARRFIQALAEDLNLKTFFMLDDNIPGIADITKNVHEDGKVTLTRVPFLQVLRSIEHQLLNQCECPDVEFQDYVDEGGDTNLSPLEKYTGPCKKYGIIGVMKLRRGSTTVKNPFIRSHVTSLVGVNTMALKANGIQYKPWRVFEDMNINNDCDNKKLWVCKYMRYQLIKRNLKSCIITSDVYVWDKTTHLTQNRIAELTTPQNEEESALFWVKDIARPTEIINSNDVNSPLQDITQRMKAIQLKSGSNRLIVISVDGDMENIYVSTKHSRQHVLLMERDFCESWGLLTVTNIQDNLKSFFDEECIVTVLTTHPVDEYMVKMVIVHVEGKARLRLPESTGGTASGSHGKSTPPMKRGQPTNKKPPAKCPKIEPTPATNLKTQSDIEKKEGGILKKPAGKIQCKTDDKDESEGKGGLQTDMQKMENDMKLLISKEQQQTEELEQMKEKLDDTKSEIVRLQEKINFEKKKKPDIRNYFKGLKI